MEAAEVAGQPCPYHPEAIIQRSPNGKWLRCTHEPSCDSDALFAAFSAQKNGHILEEEPDDGLIEEEERASIQQEPALALTSNLERWQYAVIPYVREIVEKGETDRATVMHRAWVTLGQHSNDPWLKLPAEVSDVHVRQAMEVCVDSVLAEVAGWSPSAEEPIELPFERHAIALEANREYLQRLPVIEGLCYTQAVSMITGGKHAGKSTLARWGAICVSRGYSFLERETLQGPVIYVASGDEQEVARKELLELGWDDTNENLMFLPAGKLDEQLSRDPRIVLKALAFAAKKARAVLIVLDMLFDFVTIKDEMSYAGTREALGHIQRLATEADLHVMTIHHSPKHTATSGTVEVSALGSQGLAARVTPLITVRRYGPGVHSVESTMTRDPRGKPIDQQRLVKQVDGSVTLGGHWKSYMLAEVYMPRVLELLEAEPGVEITVPEVSEQLQITYEVARACLAAMVKNGLVGRTGEGKRGKPFRYALIISAPNDLLDSARGVAESDRPRDGYLGFKDE